MRNLFLRSLLNAAQENNTIYVNDIDVNVYTEFYTDRGNRIDILIEAEEFCVIIENKIKAQLHNDLSEYTDTINNKTGKAKQIIPVVLTLSDNLTDNEREKIDNAGYIHVSYKKFFDVVENSLESYIDYADDEWVVFLRNFITNMSNLRGDGTMDAKVNQETIDFLIENDDKIFNLIEQREALANHYQYQGNMVKDILMDKYSLAFNIGRGGLKYCHSSVYYQFHDSQKPSFEIHRVMRGWEILLVTSGEHPKSNIEKWLDDNNIAYFNESLVQWDRAPVTLKVWKTNDSENILPEDVASDAYEIFMKVNNAPSM